MRQWWQSFAQRPSVAHLLRALGRFIARSADQYAAAITYFSVLSAVPVLMMAFSGLGLTLTVVYPQGLDQLRDWAGQTFVGYGKLGETLLTAATAALSNWAAIGLIGLVTAIWSGASWMAALRRAVRAVMSPDAAGGDNPSLVAQLLTDLGALLLLFFSISASGFAVLAGTSLGAELGTMLGVGGSAAWVLVTKAISLVIALALATALFWWLLGWFSPVPLPRRQHWLGAGWGAISLLGLQVVAGALIGLFSRNPAAALFGPVIVLMIFFNMFANLMLFIACWLASAEAAVPVVAAEPDPQPEAPPEPMVSQHVAERSMGVGMVAGYAVGAATGLGLGAALVSIFDGLFRRRS